MFTIWFIGFVALLFCLILLIIFNDEVGLAFNSVHKVAAIYLLLVMSICWGLTLATFVILAILTKFDMRLGDAECKECD